MKDLTNALDRMYRWLEINRPEFAEAFQTGLSYEEIKSMVSEIPLKLPQEIYDLYKWRNGLVGDITTYTSIYSSGDFSPLSTALENYQNLVEQDLICENPLIIDLIPSYNKYSLFPFFYDSNGYTYAVILNSEKLLSSPVISISGDGGFGMQYESLTAMFSMIVECYETGAYYIDIEGDYEGQIIENSKEASKIFKKYNPNLLARILSNLDSIINGEIDNLDDYDFMEYLCSNFGQLRRFREVKVVQTLINFLNKLNSETRNQRIESIVSEVIYTLGYMEDRRVVPYILSALDDQSEIIRYEAERALEEQGIEVT
jgi:hypothetical protein